MKKLLLPLLGIVILACSNDSKSVLSESDKEEIQIAMMDGRRAAAELCRSRWTDTLQLQQYILEAKARQSRYILEGKPECAKAFDSGFISGVKAILPKLANEIFSDIDTEN